MIRIPTYVNTHKYTWFKWLFILYRPNRIGDHQSLQKRNKRQKKIVHPNLTSNDIDTNRIQGTGIFTYTNTIKSTNHVGKHGKDKNPMDPMGPGLHMTQNRAALGGFGSIDHQLFWKLRSSLVGCTVSLSWNLCDFWSHNSIQSI